MSRAGYTASSCALKNPAANADILYTSEAKLEKGESMIINSSNVGMESARTYRSTTTRKLSLSTQIVSYSLSDDVLGNQTLLGNNSEESLETNEGNATAADNSETEDALKRLKSSSSAISNRIRDISEGTASRSIEQIREKCILYLWQILLGRDRASQLAEKFNIQEAYQQAQQPREIQMMEVTASEEVSFEEEESMSFSTTGTVVTADGREITFNMSVGMSRSFAQYYKQESTDLVSMCDPLVINLNDDVVGLSDQKFFFDLDCDGTEEEISTLESGNAFLALDHNNDGKINDGSELFGTKSGNGFADLAQYDEDGNGWIDEADSAFNKLKIWVKDENGNDKLYTLKEKGMGAIYLGSQETDYTLKSATSGEINGQIRRSGVFLYENGMAGTLAHVDMAICAYENAV